MHVTVLLNSFRQNLKQVQTCIFIADYKPSAGINGVRAVWMDLINDDTWEHSGETATFTKWGNTEPDAGETCCVLSSVHTWSDVICPRIHVYVCEK